MNTDEIVLEAIAPAVQPHSLSKGMKVFALSVGATAVCMLASLSFLKLEPARALPWRPLPLMGVGSSCPRRRPKSPGDRVPRKARGRWSPWGLSLAFKLFTDGVIVASLSDLYTSNGVCCPAAEAGILPGDYLLEADGMEIPSNQSLAE